MSLHQPDIFKAYDVRGTYPTRSTKTAARAIGARVRRLSRRPSASRSAATCGCRRRRWPQAFIDGATAQGADVVDYGMIATDMLYFAVARDGLDGGVADHRLAQSRSSTTA